MRNQILTERGPLSGRVYGNANYTYFVHEGRGTSRGIGPRPFFRVAIKDNEGFIDGELTAVANQALRKI